MTVPSSAPLSGIVVVSVATNLPGPLAAARLVELGASVTKVEPPSGDPLQAVAPGWYDELVAGQSVLVLDLKDAVDRDQFEQLLRGADLLLSSLRPSALVRLGLPASAHRHGVALVEIVGGDGDRAEFPGHDLTYQATHGTVLAPAMPVVPVADVLGAERAVTAALTALRMRDAGEAAAHTRVSLEAAAFAAAGAVRHGLTGPGDPLGGGLAGYGLYPVQDGHVAVAAIEPHFAERLATHLGATRQELTARFATGSRASWEAFAADHDIPLAAVRSAGSTSQSRGDRP